MERINYGSLVISLDFELMWGVIDVFTKNGYGNTNVRQVPEVIEKMLILFNEYGVHATFSTVGMIMFNNHIELQKNIPTIKPSYEIKKLSPYENNYINNILDKEEDLFFQPKIIETLKKQQGIEIGTHTFSHYYCWEKGQTKKEFETDLKKAIQIAKEKGISLKSIVFPRNEVSSEYLSICSNYGILCYRGNSLKYFNKSKSTFTNLKNRINRFLDTYVNIGGYTTISYTDIDKEELPMNIRASRMIRPYNRIFSPFEKLRFQRIQKEMEFAAKNHQIYHIWWHPHNFGANINKNMYFLEKILKCYKYCHELYNMKSFTMTEMYNKLYNEL